MQSTSWSRRMDRRRLLCRASNGHVLPSQHVLLSYTVNERLRDLRLQYRRMYGHVIDVLISKCVMESSIAQRKQHCFWRYATETRYCVEGEK